MVYRYRWLHIQEDHLQRVYCATEYLIQYAGAVLIRFSQSNRGHWLGDAKTVFKVWQSGQKTREMKTTNQFNDEMVMH